MRAYDEMQSTADDRDFSHLTPEQFAVLRRGGTEAPFSGEYVYTTDAGTYRCAACHADLFASDSKFHSECGWPSFDTSKDDAIAYRRDTSHGMVRTEVLCHNCGSHLGHVFEDGPTSTGLRYCINSLAIDLDQADG